MKVRSLIVNSRRIAIFFFYSTYSVYPQYFSRPSQNDICILLRSASKNICLGYIPAISDWSVFWLSVYISRLLSFAAVLWCQQIKLNFLNFSRKILKNLLWHALSSSNFYFLMNFVVMILLKKLFQAFKNIDFLGVRPLFCDTLQFLKGTFLYNYQMYI